jgi:septal ring factor EnvC (AmiA/AmiB activator)
LLALLPALLAQSAPPDPAAREAELESIRDEIAGLRIQLNRLSDRRAGAADDLARTGIEVRLQDRRVEEVRAERRLEEERLAETEARVEDLERRLETSREVLRGRLTDLYRVGRHGSFRLLLAVQSEEQLLPGIRLLRYLARRDSQTVESYLDDRARLGFERDELTARRLEVEALLRREALRLEQLRRTESRQKVLLASLNPEERELSEKTERLADKERKLANLLAFLVGRNTTPLSGEPIQSFRGVLDWPVEGRVTAGFGPRLDPRYKTRVPHNGIDLETVPGSPVRVVFPGRVLYAAPFQGYGMTVVVHHPGRVFTLYAGLDRLQVGVDDMLSLGAVLGGVGEKLYFEIRLENKPQDPVNWLR